MTVSHDHNPILLLLEQDAGTEAQLSQTCQVVRMSCKHFFQLSRSEFEAKGVQIVLSAPFCKRTDCIEIGHHLDMFGFEGTYLVVTDTLPNPIVILREMQQNYPDLSFRIIRQDEVIGILRDQSAPPVQ